MKKYGLFALALLAVSVVGATEKKASAAVAQMSQTAPAAMPSYTLSADEQKDYDALTPPQKVVYDAARNTGASHAEAMSQAKQVSAN